MYRISCIGHLADDVEAKTNAERGYVIARVGVNIPKRDGGEYSEEMETKWFRVLKFTNNPEEFAKNFKKGSRVLFIGRMQRVSFLGEDSEKKVEYDECVATDFQLIKKKAESEESKKQ